MLLHFCEEHVNMIAAVLLPVLKNGFTLVKEQQSVMDLCFPAATPKRQVYLGICKTPYKPETQNSL